MIIMGTKEKENVTDFRRICGRCSRTFYFDSSCSGAQVICPYCGHRHG